MKITVNFKKTYLPLLFGLVSGLTADAAPALSFSGNSLRPVEVTPEKSTGLDKIYVLYNLNGVDFSIKVSTPSRAHIYRYSNLGGGYAEEIKNVVVSGDTLTVEDVAGDYGYIVEDGDTRYYYWIVNYEPYRFKITSVEAASEQQCEYTTLNVVANAEPIHYFTINGQQKVLDREIRVEYDTQEWNEQNQTFETVGATKMYESLGSTIMITPPAYCSTSFTISGDKFLEAWNWTTELESSVINPHAVAVYTEAIQEGEAAEGNKTDDAGEDGETSDGANADSDETDASNVIKTTEGGLGGSAPATISFEAYATEGVIHHEWQMSKDPEFETIDYRFNVQNIDYTFDEEGVFYLRYIGSNADGSCESVGDTYTVNIGGSELLCPNAFTPDGDGVNDVWKVAYRSLLDFRCWIFDRYGHQMHYFDNPADGWDGKRGDKVVKPGVYYYVIQATGADGTKYKKSGDINIIRHRNAEDYKDTITE